jgi:hypothetical protein
MSLLQLFQLLLRGLTTHGAWRLDPKEVCMWQKAALAVQIPPTVNVTR